MEIFYKIDEKFILEEKTITDLGAGTGLLSILSVFFDCEYVNSYEIDENAV